MYSSECVIQKPDKKGSTIRFSNKKIINLFYRGRTINSKLELIRRLLYRKDILTMSVCTLDSINHRIQADTKNMKQITKAILSQLWNLHVEFITIRE